MPPRYLIAVLVAGALIGVGFWFVKSTRREVEESLRCDLHAMKAAGTLPPEWQNVDLDTIPIADMNLQVSPELVRKIRIADLLQALWWIWIPAIVGISLLVAAVVGRTSSRG